MQLTSIIQAARGETPVDLLLTNCRVVDVFTGEIRSDSIAVAGGVIVGFGARSARTERDLGGRYVAPGFIDAHVHIESAMVGVGEFARVLAVKGTTTVVADPHEIANVLGTTGIRYMLQSAESQPINIYFTLPSCVPATDLETAGARLSAEDLAPFWHHARVVGLAEMMNFPGVLHGDPGVMAKLQAARRHARPVDGHAPGLAGKDLHAYAAAGIGSDHECTGSAEALEKIRLGMHVMIREGSGAKNLEALLPIVTPKTSPRLMWCTDDRHPQDLLEDGHIAAMVRRAAAGGLDPIIAIQMATINPASYFGLNHIGAIAPGRQADLAVFSDLSELVVESVYCGGVLTAENGVLLPSVMAPPPVAVPPAMSLDPAAVRFDIEAGGDRVRVIEIVPDQITTRHSILPVARRGNQAVADPERDLLKIAVVERYSGKARRAVGFVRGLGLSRGAMASSVAHDSHNIIVAGAGDADMLAVLEAVVRMGGGLAIAVSGEVKAACPLPIAGLMSAEPLAETSRKMRSLVQMARDLGTPLHDPFMTLSFLALPVIPELKITDKGLIDVNAFEVVPLFV